MRTKIFYFSATGNSLYVAKRISNNINQCEVISIPKIIKEGNFEFDSENIGFVFPLHCFGLPIIVKDFIDRIQIREDAFVFAIQVTGGGSTDNTFADINNMLKKSGAKLSTISEVKYISNYIRAGRNATNERAIKAVQKNESVIDNIIELIKEKQVNSKDIKEKFTHRLLYKLWKDYYINKDSKFNVNDKCIGCKICEKICPIENIKIENEVITWNKKCIDCMACINNCPKNAINIGEKTLNKNRYRNPNIKLDELL